MSTTTSRNLTACSGSPPRYSKHTRNMFWESSTASVAPEFATSNLNATETKNLTRSRCRTCPLMRPLKGNVSLKSHAWRTHHWRAIPTGKDTCSRSLGEEQLALALLASNDGAVLRNGTFLEMGGGDGLQESNTVLLEACLGWRGVLIEPNPRLKRTICSNRPWALAYSLAVCNQTSMKYRVSLNPKQWTTGGAPSLLNAQSRGRSFVKDYTVPCAPLSALLAPHVPHIDYMSIDVEGAEHLVLSTIDWTRLSVHLIGVEQSTSSRAKNAAVRKLLREHDFVHVHTHWIWRGGLADEFFLNGTYLRRHLGRQAVLHGVDALLHNAHPPEQAVINQLALNARKPSLYGCCLPKQRHCDGVPPCGPEGHLDGMG